MRPQASLNLSILSGRDGAVSSGSLHGDPRHSHRGGVLPLEQEEDTHRDPGGRELEAQAGEALNSIAKNYFLRFRFRLLTSYGSSCGSGSGSAACSVSRQ